MSLDDLKKKPGNLIRSEDWNALIDEIEARVKKEGDTMTGALALGNNSQILVNNDFPIKMERFTNLGDFVGFSGNGDTEYSADEWNAAIIGFRIKSVDQLTTAGTNFDFLQVYLAIGDNNNWYIMADIAAHEQWYVDVMFISNKISKRMSRTDWPKTRDKMGKVIIKDQWTKPKP